MKNHSTPMKLILLISFFLNFSALPIVAKELYEEKSTEDSLYIRGIVSKVYPDKMQISVKPFKSKRVLIILDPETILDGASQIGELEKEQQVKVWYSTNNGDNRALKIKIMMKLGC